MALDKEAHILWMIENGKDIHIMAHYIVAAQAMTCSIKEQNILYCKYIKEREDAKAMLHGQSTNNGKMVLL